MKIKKYRFLIIIFVVIILLIIFIRSCVTSAFKLITQQSLTKQEKELKWKSYYDQYLNLFTKESQEKLSLFNRNISKSKNPFALFTYDNDYTVIVHKVSLSNNIPLNKRINIEKANEGLSTGVFYNGSEIDNINFYQANEHDSIVEKIFISYSDTLLNSYNIGDSIVNFNMTGTKFSVSYEPKGIKDFAIISTQSGLQDKHIVLLNMNILIYKKNKSLFFIITYPRDKGLKIDNYFTAKLLRI